jgi:hypothetical protein
MKSFNYTLNIFIPSRGTRAREFRAVARYHLCASFPATTHTLC